MKLKLDLHPIFSDSRQIEAALQSIIDDACEKRVSEVEIIPGKGSGALKKTVLRFLDRPEVKAKYHRIEKDSDNWGRLFVHFRWDRSAERSAPALNEATALARCFCCRAEITVSEDRDLLVAQGRLVQKVECPSCDSPNRATLYLDRLGQVRATSESGYE